MRQSFLVLRLIIYVTAFVAFWLWLGTLVLPFDEKVNLAFPTWLSPIGLLLVVFGVLLVLSCLFVFVTRGRGTPAPFDAPREFVATGPYRFVRNPMYLGLFAQIFGFGLFIGSLSILALGLITTLAAHLLVLLYEEPTLESRFGESYLAYKRSVHRWIPRQPQTSNPLHND